MKTRRRAHQILFVLVISMIIISLVVFYLLKDNHTGPLVRNAYDPNVGSKAILVNNHTIRIDIIAEPHPDWSVDISSIDNFSIAFRVDNDKGPSVRLGTEGLYDIQDGLGNPYTLVLLDKNDNGLLDSGDNMTIVTSSDRFTVGGYFVFLMYEPTQISTCIAQIYVT